jgi:hypothetical protein
VVELGAAVDELSEGSAVVPDVAAVEVGASPEVGGSGELELEVSGWAAVVAGASAPVQPARIRAFDNKRHVLEYMVYAPSKQ